jgi:hypothetical protein
MPFCGPCFVHDLTLLPLRVNHTRSPVRSETRAGSFPEARLLGQSLATTSEHVNTKTKCAYEQQVCRALCAGAVQPWFRPAARDGPG